MSQVLTPAEVEAALIDAVNEVARGIDEVTKRLSAYREAQRLFDVAEASAFMRAEGAMDARKRIAVLATVDARETLDVCEVAWKYAERRTRAAEGRLSAYQTISRSVQSAYGAAGL